MRFFWIILVVLITGCVSVPDGIEPVKDFQSNRYLGQWFEIARLDHSFERGLEQVTATYSKRKDGGINVINRGFNTESQEWQQAEGKAYFVGDSNEGHLKVSFFGPFYGSYIIFDLGKNYEYSLITSSSKSYLWLLSRTPVIDEKLRIDLIDKMTGLGFNTNELIFVKQDYKLSGGIRSGEK